MGDYNLYLTLGGGSGNKGGDGFVEDPAGHGNIVWQTRFGELSAEEDAFAGALMRAFADGADDLDACAAELNRQYLSMPTGGPWTAISLGEYLAALSRTSL